MSKKVVGWLRDSYYLDFMRIKIPDDSHPTDTARTTFLLEFAIDTIREKQKWVSPEEKEETEDKFVKSLDGVFR